MTGIFQPHYILMGPHLYIRSIADQNVVMQTFSHTHSSRVLIPSYLLHENSLVVSCCSVICLAITTSTNHNGFFKFLGFQSRFPQHYCQRISQEEYQIQRGFRFKCSSGTVFNKVLTLHFNAQISYCLFQLTNMRCSSVQKQQQNSWVATSSTKEATVHAVKCRSDCLEMAAHADVLPVIHQNDYFFGVYIFFM